MDCMWSTWYISHIPVYTVPERAFVFQVKNFLSLYFVFVLKVYEILTMVCNIGDTAM